MTRPQRPKKASFASGILTSEALRCGSRRPGANLTASSYRYQGRQRWLTIGEHGSPWTPDTARSNAKEALYQASHGEDPQATKVETKLKSGTVKELFERYFVEGRIDKPLKRESSWKVDQYNYKRHIEPLLGKRVARELTLSDLSQFQAQVANGKTSVTVRTKSGKQHAVVKAGLVQPPAPCGCFRQ